MVKIPKMPVYYLKIPYDGFKHYMSSVFALLKEWKGHPFGNGIVNASIGMNGDILIGFISPEFREKYTQKYNYRIDEHFIIKEAES